jgi:hypothetical protein
MGYLNEEVRCTELSSSERIPWIMPPVVQTVLWVGIIKTNYDHLNGASTFSTTTLSIMTISIKTLSIKGFLATLNIKAH